VVLALGHSARDTFAMLHERGVFMEAKPFSLGFRIEHPQSVIDAARFGPNAGNPILGAADYKLVHHAMNGEGQGRSVYSFCMCPGGTVVAATSEEGRVVTNGMSQYSRNERNANAGIVVGITPDDYRAAGSAGSTRPVDPLDGIAEPEIVIGQPVATLSDDGQVAPLDAEHIEFVYELCSPVELATRVRHLLDHARPPEVGVGERASLEVADDQCRFLGNVGMYRCTYPGFGGDDGVPVLMVPIDG